MQITMTDIQKKLVPGIFSDMREDLLEFARANTIVANSGAYKLFLSNIQEYIKNCKDSGADTMTIDIPDDQEVASLNQISVSISDNGGGFNETMLPEGVSSRSYGSVLSGKVKIVSDKLDNKELSGGAGQGLAQAYVALKNERYEGDVIISKVPAGGAKVTLVSNKTVFDLNEFMLVQKSYDRNPATKEAVTLKQFEKDEKPRVKALKVEAYDIEDNPVTPVPEEVEQLNQATSPYKEALEQTKDDFGEELHGKFSSTHDLENREAIIERLTRKFKATTADNKSSVKDSSSSSKVEFFDDDEDDDEQNNNQTTFTP